MISLLRRFSSSPSLKRFRCLSNSSSSIQSFQFSTDLANNNESRSKNLDRIADELLSLSKLERYDYSILFRLKLGFQNYGPMVSAPSAAGSLAAAAASPAESAKAEEKKSFDVKIEKFEAAAKIKIIKEVRSFTDLGLKEAKDLVEKAPVVVKKGLTKEEAGAIMEKLKELGATVVLE